MKTGWQSRLAKSAFIFLPVAGIMSITNPQQDAYVDYAASRLTSEIQNSICQGPQLPAGLLWEEVGKYTTDTCKSGLATGLAWQDKTIKEFIANSTKRQNYFLLSTYTTKVSGYNFRTIGAFGNFLTFQK